MNEIIQDKLKINPNFENNLNYEKRLKNFL